MRLIGCSVLSDIKVGKKTPLTMDCSWTVTREEIKTRSFDLKADEDVRKPDELLDLIEAKGKEVSEALAKFRK